MNRFLILSLTLMFSVFPFKAQESDAQIDARMRAEIAANPKISAGIYYAYPYTTDSLAPVPTGYKPFYISHYGRHGSRWVESEKWHKTVLNVLNKQKNADNLTPLGEEFLSVMDKSQQFTVGHEGELSRLGELQHAGIAKRMAARFPELFEDGTFIIARSSETPRCIISMAAFCEGLKEVNPTLYIERHASPGDASFIKYHSPAGNDLYYKDQPWKKDLKIKRDSLNMCMATAKKIFKNPEKVKTLPDFMKTLHDVAKSFQNNSEFNYDLLQYFDVEDMYNLVKGEDYLQYVRHGNSIEGNCEGAKSADHLLGDIVKCADDAIIGKRAKVDLRFGHDVFLLDLFSYMDIETMNARVKGIDEAYRVWQTARISPMAVNFQLTLFRNSSGDVIATIRVNERPVKIAGVDEFAPGYYRWSDLKAKWNK